MPQKTGWNLLPYGASTFTGLSDTPASLSGEGSKYVRVNAGGTALEFAAVAPGGGGGYPAVQVPNDSLTLRYDFGGQEEGLFKVNMGTRNRWEVVPSSPASGVAAEYSLMFTEVGLNDTVTFPEAFLYVLDSMPIGSINLHQSEKQPDPGLLVRWAVLLDLRQPGQ
jgi:hypothetical protein